jgi:hypothetical protein
MDQPFASCQTLRLAGCGSHRPVFHTGAYRFSTQAQNRFHSDEMRASLFFVETIQRFFQRWLRQY